ncbi:MULTISPECIES: hypothetical protein [Rhizobium]|uniref:Uncharacterized protein n=1 Tax=Rhizobium tropici TaxID=398 RepID=A0A6P1C821_RHITR|nr:MULTISPECIES: hypothetical protein [Rhizobium]MBB4242383.1 hypothetical protein [Rhizobium tropici]MBB5594026.1 hypothetical protein [Rhizobium tropici]MBB6492854.1 hypothetical protein [Rhizobium tropici]NEV13359.1 hypothetical protein [Rhizobium tropici]TGE97021.1 hypothetical protein C9417_15430 [Rhizobium sp. SEMIA 4088]
MPVGNYSANVHFNGPDELVIDVGGKLTIVNGAQITGLDSVVTAAIKNKAQVQALTPSSTAADIVAALKA